MMQQFISLKKLFTFREKLASYFFEKKIIEENGLEVVFYKNKLLLNTTSVNYSNGSLQYRLHQAFSYFDIYSQTFGSILLLGFGFGSAIQLFQNRSMNIDSIIGVENNKHIISIAHQWYDFAPNIEIIHQDVMDYLKYCKDTFDFILVDVFEDDKVPDILLEKNNLLNVFSKLNRGGRCIMNVINHPKNPIENIVGIFDEQLDLMGEHIFLYKEQSND